MKSFSELILGTRNNKRMPLLPINYSNNKILHNEPAAHSWCCKVISLAEPLLMHDLVLVKSYKVKLFWVPQVKVWAHQ